MRLRDRERLVEGQPAEPLDRRRLVGDVDLVERRWERKRLRLERVAMAGGGRRRQRDSRGADVVLVEREPAVRREVREVEEEGRARGRAVPDGGHRLPREDVRLVVRLVGRVVDEAAVLVQREADVRERAPARRPDGRAPVAPARRDLGAAALVLPVAVQVLADEGRVVPGLLEPDRQRVRVVEPHVAAERRPVPADAVVVRVLPRQQRRARRAAERVRREARVEAHALPDEQPVDVRHVAQRVRRLVVGLDDDDVRPVVDLLHDGGRRVRPRGEREQTGDREPCPEAPSHVAVEGTESLRARPARGTSRGRRRRRAGTSRGACARSANACGCRGARGRP